MNRDLKKLKFTECPPAIQKEVLDNMKFVGWNEKRDGNRKNIVVRLKNGELYGYGLV